VQQQLDKRVEKLAVSSPTPGLGRLAELFVSCSFAGPSGRKCISGQCQLAAAQLLDKVESPEKWLSISSGPPPERTMEMKNLVAYPLAIRAKIAALQIAPPLLIPRGKTPREAQFAECRLTRTSPTTQIKLRRHRILTSRELME
jgi:hypothetical protein